jgi:hypothetical protein
MGHARLQRSLSKKSCSPDPSACEGLFGKLKHEMFYNRDGSGVNIHLLNLYNKYLILYYESIRVSMNSWISCLRCPKNHFPPLPPKKFIF